MQEAHEFWVSDEPEEAVRKVKITLKRMGELTSVVPGEYIIGKIAFGVKPVKVQIGWRPEEAGTKMDAAVRGGRSALAARAVGTTLIIEAHTGDNSEAAARSAIERFEDAYLHFDRADYQPDRLGILPITIIGITIALILLGVLLWRSPGFQRMLPKMPAAYLPEDKSTPAPEKPKDDPTADDNGTSKS